MDSFVGSPLAATPEPAVVIRGRVWLDSIYTPGCVAQWLMLIDAE
jgi:hypothetical protein